MLGFEDLSGLSEHAQAFLRPRPRLAEGRAIAPLAGAMMDVSDGLLLDCWRMATASDVTIQLDGAAIPVADPARRDECLRWGDDYELLFTLPDGAKPPVPATRIGSVGSRGQEPLRLDATSFTAPEMLGFRH
jgi:thiamine-monophosphate kinase